MNVERPIVRSARNDEAPTVPSAKEQVMAIGSFSAGLSGLTANSEALKVVGNNLANLNTVGYKASTVAFQELVSQGGGSASARGLGVAVAAVAPIFSQGSIESSREATNVAIQGNGMFVVKGPQGNVYTRAGNFSFNADGDLVTPDGYKVQGYTNIDPVTGEVITSGEPTDIRVPPGILRAPTPTSTMTIASNLDAEASVGDTLDASMQVFDSLGAAHVMTITYTNTGPGQWSYSMTLPGADVQPPVATPAVVAAGTLAFDSEGILSSITPTAPSTGGGAATPGPIAPVEFTSPAFANGATASTITWNVVDNNGTASLTGFASPSATSSKTQNGTPAGRLDLISIANDGTITAKVGAGEAAAVARLSLATFNNFKGLVDIGANKFQSSLESGLPNVGEPGTGGRGTVIGSALEQSNVDIAYEFTQMILAQRGYQANSKTITVSDEILMDTLNLKR
jgi:flagellar hook protein FlgE